MLSIGLSEIILIAVVAIVVVGPERLPQVMRQLGRWYGQLRRAADELRRAFVLEADRQDAEERYSKLQERRKVAAEARKRAMDSAGKGAVAHAADMPDPDPMAIDREVRAPNSDEATPSADDADTAPEPEESPPANDKSPTDNAPTINEEPPEPPNATAEEATP